jgi:hypothetical protein
MVQPNRIQRGNNRFTNLISQVHVKLLLLNLWISSISTSLGLENKTTHSLHGFATHTPAPPSKKKGYNTKRRYQQTHRDKQKTPQITKDQLDSTFGK